MRWRGAYYECTNCGERLPISRDAKPRAVVYGASGKTNERVISLDGVEVHRCAIVDRFERERGKAMQKRGRAVREREKADAHDRNEVRHKEAAALHDLAADLHERAADFFERHDLESS